MGIIAIMHGHKIKKRNSRSFGSGMKFKMFCYSLVFITNSYAQAYKNISLQTNLASILNVGIDIPLPKKYSINANINTFKFPLFNNISIANQRVNLRKYFLQEKRNLNDFIPYCFAGMRFRQGSIYYEIKPNIYEIGKLNVQYLSLGIGLKGKYFDFCLGVDNIISTKYNEIYTKEYYGNPKNIKPWKQNAALHLGLIVNIWNIKIFRYS